MCNIFRSILLRLHSIFIKMSDRKKIVYQSRYMLLQCILQRDDRRCYYCYV